MDGPHDSPALTNLWINGAGARVMARRCGTGPASVCLHATGHGARDFDRMAQRLGGAFEFIAIDWPGQGDSPREAAPASAARYAEILENVVDQLGLQRCFLLGNSIGGAAAIIYAAKHPERVRGLVLCNSGGLVASNLLVRMYCRMIARRFERGAAGARSFRKWFARYYRQVLPREEAAWRREEIVAAGVRSAPVLAEAWRSFAAPDADIRALVPSLTMPVLYAWGLRDRTLPWAWVKPAAQQTPRAEIALFDAGHAVFLEEPEAFDAALSRFATGISADDGGRVQAA